MSERADYADDDSPAAHPIWVALAYLTVGGLVGGSLAAVGCFVYMICVLSRPL